MTDWQEVVRAALRTIEARSGMDVRGCSPSELDELQRRRAIQLPPSYAMFLAAAGRDNGDFLHGSDLRLQDLDGLQEGAASLFEECRVPPLPEDAFVFCGHHDYQYLFFLLRDGADPPVYHYMEQDFSFTLVASTFSAWLAQTVSEEFQSKK